MSSTAEQEWYLDKCGPFPILTPTSIDELCEYIRKAREASSAVFPLGGRTMLDFGLPPDREGQGLDLTQLSEVLDFPARDMTVTVQAGITIHELEQTLLEENLRLPIDVPLPNQATLGGAVAVNMSGSRRYGFGTLRDYVIGISTINDEGQQVKAGGRVVKNVAGYDLCKLHTGALGTLGIISQLTLKLKPIPETSVLVIQSLADDKLESLLNQIHQTRTRPVCVDVLNASAAKALNLSGDTPLPEGDWVIVLGFEESAETIRWQTQQIIAELATASLTSSDVRVHLACQPLWSALRDFPLLPEVQLSFKVNLLPHATAKLCQQLQHHPDEVLIQTHAGNGIIIGHVRELTLDRAKKLIQSIQQETKKASGNVVITRCPAEWKPELPIWGTPRNDAFLMRTIKEKLDPQRIFNPGRFIEGL